MTQQPGDAQTTTVSPSRRSSSRRQQAATYASTIEERARQRAKAERRFIEHLTFVLGFTVFLFIVNVATGSDSWWFYWWPIGWSIFLITHAIRLYGPQNRFDDDWEERKTQELIAKKQQPAPSASEAAKPAQGPMSEMPGLIANGGLEVAKMRVDAVQISKPEVQQQALRICARADEILKVLAEPGRDVQLGREFVDQVLPTAQTVFGSYARLSGRNISSAQAALARVETNDLPLIERTLDDIYQQLHRHDVISLEVASEMLELGKPG